NAVAGAPDRQIANARIVVLDPDARQVLRGRSAETAVARDPRLWVVFVAAGRDPEVQEIEAEAAARLYVLNSLRARVKGSTTTFGQILKSEQGVAVLVDRSVQEGAGEGAAGTSRVGGAARTVAARHGVAQLTDDRFEREVIVQVADDVRADIELIRAIPAAVSALKTVRDSAQQGHPVHQSDLDPIKTRVD